jgi:hypothetical protein
MLTFTGRLVASGLLILQAGAWIALLAVADTIREALPPGAMLWGPWAVALPASFLTLALVVRSADRHEWIS